MVDNPSRGMRTFFTLRWIITTLLAIAVVGVMVRLGFWQLDRLAQRRAFNAAVEAQISAPALDLNRTIPASGLEEMEYRAVTVTGVFDPQNEIVLRNQVYETRPGYDLLTPLHINGSTQTVLVDRGFIEMDQASPEARAKYIRPGEVTVQGVIRLPHVPHYFGVPDPTLAPGESRLDAWNSINMERIQQQVPYSVLPVYIQASPDLAASTSYPIARVEMPEISEGPHMGYAIQWFSFAGLLAFGYPVFVRKQLWPKTRKKAAARHETLAQ